MGHADTNDLPSGAASSKTTIHLHVKPNCKCGECQEIFKTTKCWSPAHGPRQAPLGGTEVEVDEPHERNLSATPTQSSEGQHPDVLQGRSSGSFTQSLTGRANFASWLTASQSFAKSTVRCADCPGRLTWTPSQPGAQLSSYHGAPASDPQPTLSRLGSVPAAAHQRPRPGRGVHMPGRRPLQVGMGGRPGVAVSLASEGWGCAEGGPGAPVPDRPQPARRAPPRLPQSCHRPGASSLQTLVPVCHRRRQEPFSLAGQLC